MNGVRHNPKISFHCVCRACGTKCIRGTHILGAWSPKQHQFAPLHLIFYGLLLHVFTLCRKMCVNSLHVNCGSSVWKVLMLALYHVEFSDGS